MGVWAGLGVWAELGGVGDRAASVCSLCGRVWAEPRDGGVCVGAGLESVGGAWECGRGWGCGRGVVAWAGLRDSGMGVGG